MPAFSEVIYNPIDLIVAKLNTDNSYGTPVRVDYFEKVAFDFEADEDEIKSGGLIVEKLSIATKVTGTMDNGALNFAAMSILQGDAPTTVYSTTPNQYQYTDITVGGAGNPYFGLLVQYASTLGGSLIAGFPKSMLTKKPGFDIDQNKFRVGSAEFNALAPSVISRRVARLLKYETAPSFVLTSAYVQGFFSGMF